MLAGMALVLTHNVWTADWPLLITLLGWLGVIGGAVRIIVPQGTQEIGRRYAGEPDRLDHRRRDLARDRRRALLLRLFPVGRCDDDRDAKRSSS